MKSYTKVYHPYGGYYLTPFSRWQGSLQNDNAVSLGALTARRWFLEKKKIDPTVLDYLYFGSTVAQNHWFIAHNWATSILTDDKKFLPGLFVGQACSTSTTVLNLAAKDIELGVYEVGFGLMADRCSNGPHTTWADPLGPGGQPDREDWNMDNFGGTPVTGSPWQRPQRTSLPISGSPRRSATWSCSGGSSSSWKGARTTGHSRSATCSPPRSR